MNNFYEEFKDTTHYEKNNAFLKACKDGDFEKIKYLLTSPELEDHANIDVYESESDFNGYLYACKNGRLDIVRYLLTSPELKYHQSIHSTNRADETGLYIASKYGHVDIVDYLLASPELKEHCNIHNDDYWALSLACENGHINVIKYLFNSPHLKNYNVQKDGNELLHLACEHGHTEIARFLLTRSDLKDTADLDKALFVSCWSEKIEIAQYLIFDLNIPRNSDTMADLLKYHTPFAEKLESLFNARELNKELSVELPSSINNTKKVKI
jgi:ankyrin repeat protein